MPRETQFKDFKAPKSYRCAPMHALPAMHMTLDMIQLFGSALTSVFAGAIDGEVGLDTVAKLVMMDGLQSLQPRDHDRILFGCLAGVQYDGLEGNLGSEKTFNAHFDEHGLMEAYSVLFWAMQVNFQAYFGDALSLFAARQQAERAKQDLQKAGTSPMSTT